MKRTKKNKRNRPRLRYENTVRGSNRSTVSDRPASVEGFKRFEGEGGLIRGEYNKWNGYLPEAPGPPPRSRLGPRRKRRGPRKQEVYEAGRLILPPRLYISNPRATSFPLRRSGLRPLSKRGILKRQRSRYRKRSETVRRRKKGVRLRRRRIPSARGKRKLLVPSVKKRDAKTEEPSEEATLFGSELDELENKSIEIKSYDGGEEIGTTTDPCSNEELNGNRQSEIDQSFDSFSTEALFFEPDDFLHSSPSTKTSQRPASTAVVKEIAPEYLEPEDIKSVVLNPQNAELAEIPPSSGGPPVIFLTSHSTFKSPRKLAEVDEREITEVAPDIVNGLLEANTELDELDLADQCLKEKEGRRGPQKTHWPNLPFQVPELSHLTSNASAKMRCESHYQEKCVCSLSRVVRRFGRVLEKVEDVYSVLREVALLTCDSYIPIENYQQLVTSIKPRVISSKPKEIYPDSASGAKEIPSETFQELIIRIFPRRDETMIVFPSHEAKIPCLSDEIQLSPIWADFANYVWTHSNKRAITEGRIAFDGANGGILTITDVTFWDSDKYICTATYKNPESEELVTNSFPHTLTVVELPKLVLHMLIHYKAKAECDQELLETFELYMPKQLEKKICSAGNDCICRIEIYNPICRTSTSKGKESVNSKSIWRLEENKEGQIEHIEVPESDDGEMEISMVYKLDLKPVWKFIPQAANKSKCDPYCQQKISFKIIQFLKESFSYALTLPVKTTTGIVFEPDFSISDMKTIIACDGGLQLSEGFCIPCEEGFYSEEGSTQCLPCPPGFYQDKIASKSCEMCPHPFKRGCFSLLKPVFGAIVLISIIIIILGAIFSKGAKGKLTKVLGKIDLRKMCTRIDERKKSSKKEKQIDKLKESRRYGLRADPVIGACGSEDGYSSTCSVHQLSISSSLILQEFNSSKREPSSGPGLPRFDS